MAWATTSYAFWSLHIIHKVFQQYVFVNEFSHGVIINYTKTIVLTSAIQVMHK